MSGYCRSCDYYTYEGENEKGYCSWYRAYYWPSEYCNHWTQGDDETDDEEPEDNTGGGMCFLTTACCEYKGLPDDCKELTALRRFRDGYLKAQPYGEELIAMYYADAPSLVKAINERKDKAEIYEEIFTRIHEIIDLISTGKNDAAVIRYLMMVYSLMSRVR